MANSDKITDRELSLELKTQIQTSLTHTTESDKHVSSSDRTNWNAKLDKTSATATSGNNGLMASADKVKLDSIEQGANKYIHPTTTVDDTKKYVSVTVNSAGHITGGSNEGDLTKVINIKVTSSESLQGYTADKFAKSSDTILGGSPSATTPALTDNSNRIATTAFVKNTIGSGKFVVVQATAPTDTNVIWINSTNSGLYYHNGTKFVPIVIQAT